jgi:uncharacterized protein with HXXEE motif
MVFGTRSESNYAMNWLVGQWQWPFACLFTAGILLLLTPIWFHAAGTALALIVLQLPLYMVHQFEEHTGDRFRKYLNANVAHCEALTPTATFWINSLGVWGLDFMAVFLATFVNLSFGLVAFYLPIINGLTHIREAIARREYNPGLCTSVFLFLPISGLSLYLVAAQSGATWVDHLAAAAIAVAVHVAIIAYLVVRIHHLRTATATR